MKGAVNRHVVVFSVALVWLVLDQLTKLWAAGALVTQYGGSLPVIEGVFHFTYVENRGAAFSLLQNQRWLFIVLTALSFCSFSSNKLERL